MDNPDLWKRLGRAPATTAHRRMVVGKVESHMDDIDIEEGYGTYLIGEGTDEADRLVMLLADAVEWSRGWPGTVTRSSTPLSKPGSSNGCG